MTTQQLQVFHVLGVGHNLRALRLLDRKVNLLVSAWTYHTKSELRRDRLLIREKAECLLIDSGFLSAAKQGCIDWAKQQTRVLEIADELQSDRVAMMDVPMTPEVLAAAGLVTASGKPDWERALQFTFENAQTLASITTSLAKGYINQGWTLEQRAACQSLLAQLPPPNWWGVGGVALRGQAELYEHVQWCRTAIQGHLHCFGIAHPERLRTMAQMGINSCDSATAAIATAHARIIVNGRQQDLNRDRSTVARNGKMHALLYLYNIEGIEHAAHHGTEATADWQGPEQARLAL